MAVSSARRLARLHDAVEAMAQPDAPEREPQQIAALLADIVPTDAVGYYVVQLPGTITEYGHYPEKMASAELVATVERIIPDHPMTRHVVRTGSREAVRMSDLLSIRELKRLPVYADLYRPLGWDRYMAAYLPGSGPSLSAITLGRRGVDFSDADRQLLEIARLALTQALEVARYRELAAAALSALETTVDVRPAVIVLDPRHTIQVATRDARALLAAYFGSHGGDEQRLPEELASWLALQRADRHELYVVRRRGRALTVSATPSGHHLVLLLTESSELKALTKRELQVLELVARGMTNSAIAHCLGIGSRTVEEHLARAFAKLGASNRTEAVMKAFGTPAPDGSGGP